MIKKILKISFIITFFAFTSCERDEICIDPVTPKLLVTFYDKDNPTVSKTVNDLLVEIDSLGVFIPFETAKTTDSIALPLRIDVDNTKYRFIKNYNDATNEISDEFIVNYQRELQFVSRSCGYKTIFNNITISNLTNNWIDHIVINQQNIINEKEAHLNIYH